MTGDSGKDSGLLELKGEPNKQEGIRDCSHEAASLGEGMAWLLTFAPDAF